jgi:carboxymethylenebutenolidase
MKNPLLSEMPLNPESPPRVKRAGAGAGSSRLAWALATTWILTAVLPCAAPAQQPAAEPEHAQRMAKEHAEDDTSASPATVPRPRNPVMGAELGTGTDRLGYLAQPYALANPENPLPAIVVIHEWWGLNDNVRAMTDRLAGEGYLALAVDLYEGQTADTPADAMALMNAAMAQPKSVVEQLRSALDFLRDRHKAPRVAVLGWCFGGGWALQSAIQLADEVDAAVIYYGRVTSDEVELAKIDDPILGFFGSEDQGIPVEGVQDFAAALQRLGKEATIQVYDGADHAFANPSGTRYQPEAAEDAWGKTLSFLTYALR